MTRADRPAVSSAETEESSATTKVSATVAVSPLFRLDTGAARPDRKQPVRCEPLASGNNSELGRAQTLGQFGHLAVGVSDVGGSCRAKASDTSCVPADGYPGP